MSGLTQNQRTKNGFAVDASQVRKILDGRTTPIHQIGSHYKFVDSSSLGMNRVGKPYVDRAAVSAKTLISVATVDRKKDLLIPAGCNLSQYRKNPVVMWGHGLEGLSTPIGRSEDNDGRLTVVINDDSVEATCFFAQSSVEAMQIFELVDEGVVRATSVRETPIRVRSKWIDGREILIVDEWFLEEWSWCALGVNPDSVAKAIHRNRLGGSKIVPSVMKSLLSVAPQLKALGIGLPGKNKMAGDADETVEDVDKTTPADEAAASAGDDAGAGDSGAGEGAGSEPMELDPDMMPYGKQIIDSTHSVLKQCYKTLNGCLDHRLEHEGVKGSMSAIRDSLGDHLKALEGASVEHYPSIKSSLSTEDEGESEDDMGDDQLDSEMKSMLSLNLSTRHQMVGLTHQLKSLISANNLTPKQKKILTEVVNHQGRLVDQAKATALKSMNAKAKTAISPDEQKKLDEALAAVNKLSANA